VSPNVEFLNNSLTSRSQLLKCKEILLNLQRQLVLLSKMLIHRYYEILTSMMVGVLILLIDSEAEPDAEDQTNLHRHARYNAQEAIALARQRAQQFDTQSALDRKTNEALRLAKAQAHIRGDDELGSGSSSTPLVDCTFFPVIKTKSNNVP
jgi:hypothetical protein